MDRTPVRGDHRDRADRRRGIAAIAVAVVLLASACSADDDEGADEGAPPGTTLVVAPELQAVMDAAEAEGELTLSWAGVLGGVDGVSELIDGFEDYYDLDIDVRFTPGSGQGEMAAKVETELGADKPASTDVLSLNAYAVVQLSGRGVLEEVDWAGFSPNVTDPEMLAPSGVAVSVEAWPLGIAYHTGRVAADEVPTSLEDLLEPEYEGRIYTTPFGAGFDLLASDEGWGRERTLEFTEQFVGQIGGLGFTIQPLLSGEFDVMALLVPPSLALAAKEDGAPIEFLVPSDAALFYENLVSIPANSAHPNAARLFIDYLMSPEGQKVLRDLDFVDSPTVPGSVTAAQIDEAEASGADFVYGDVEFYAAQDREQFRRNADDILDIIENRD
jgi:ABC-type Fe3+ transport system substrate-binding protein